MVRLEFLWYSVQIKQLKIQEAGYNATFAINNECKDENNDKFLRFPHLLHRDTAGVRATSYLVFPYHVRKPLANQSGSNLLLLASGYR